MVTLYFMVLRRTSIVRIIRGLVPAADVAPEGVGPWPVHRNDCILQNVYTAVTTL